ncbi:Peroxisomal and mitochondrial division factor [Arachis hypogaea]|nr:Peroxisomal and mitochondrial division factor [Arachis hypogaea]
MESKKIGALEKKDVDERNKWTKVEEELREKIQEKEKEGLELGQKTKEVERFANLKSSDIEEGVKEKLNLQEALKKSEEREKSLELFVARLKEEVGVAENVIRGLNQKVDTVNGGVNRNRVIGRDGKRVKGLNVQWPVVAAGSTVVAAAAVIWFYFWLIHENNDDDGFLYGLMFIKLVNFDFLLKSRNTY